MLERIKWLTIMIAIAILLMGAQTVVARVMISPAATIASTTTPTHKPSATTEPTKTSSPTNTNTPRSGVSISEIFYDPTGNNLPGEYVLIKNSLSKPINLLGWSLRDDQKNTFTFPTYLLRAGTTVKVWTRTGVDTTDNLYWNQSTEVWNVGGDCGYLRDPQGNLQSYICY